MRADVIKIGNSKGIRLPAALLKQCGIGTKVELEVRDNCIILKPAKTVREGWGAAFQRMNKNHDDILVVPDEIDTDLLEDGE